MAKFIKSKFRVLWGTIFTFFAGIFTTDITSKEAKDVDEEAEETEVAQADEALDPVRLRIWLLQFRLQSGSVNDPQS